jgi:hypothetical protein
MRSGDVIPLAELMDDKIRWIGSESLGDPPPECKATRKRRPCSNALSRRCPPGILRR